MIADFADRTIAEIAAARPADVERGRDLLREINPDGIDVGGHVIANLGFTRAALGDLTPAEWRRVATTLLALVRREPIKSSPRYVPERVLLGALALELDSYARCAGEEDDGAVQPAGPGLSSGLG